MQKSYTNGYYSQNKRLNACCFFRDMTIGNEKELFVLPVDCRIDNLIDNEDAAHQQGERCTDHHWPQFPDRAIHYRHVTEKMLAGKIASRVDRPHREKQRWPQNEYQIQLVGEALQLDRK